MLWGKQEGLTSPQLSSLIQHMGVSIHEGTLLLCFSVPLSPGSATPSAKAGRSLMDSMEVVVGGRHSGWEEGGAHGRALAQAQAQAEGLTMSKWLVSHPDQSE